MEFNKLLLKIFIKIKVIPMSIRHQSEIKNPSKGNLFLGAKRRRRAHNNSMEFQESLSTINSSNLRSFNTSMRVDNPNNLADPYKRFYSNQSSSILKESKFEPKYITNSPEPKNFGSQSKKSYLNMLRPSMNISMDRFRGGQGYNFNNALSGSPSQLTSIPSQKSLDSSSKIDSMHRNHIVLAARLEVATHKNSQLKKRYKAQVTTRNQKLMEEMRYRDYKNNKIQELNFSDKIHHFFRRHPTKREYDKSGISAPEELTRMITDDHRKREEEELLASVPKEEPRIFTQKIKEHEAKLKEIVEKEKIEEEKDPNRLILKQNSTNIDPAKLIDGLKPFDKNEKLDQSLFDDLRISKRDRARLKMVNLANTSNFVLKSKLNGEEPKIRPYRKFRAIAK